MGFLSLVRVFNKNKPLLCLAFHSKGVTVNDMCDLLIDVMDDIKMSYGSPVLIGSGNGGVVKHMEPSEYAYHLVGKLYGKIDFNSSAMIISPEHFVGDIEYSINIYPSDDDIKIRIVDGRGSLIFYGDIEDIKINRSGSLDHVTASKIIENIKRKKNLVSGLFASFNNIKGSNYLIITYDGKKYIVDGDFDSGLKFASLHFEKNSEDDESESHFGLSSFRVCDVVDEDLLKELDGVCR